MKNSNKWARNVRAVAKTVTGLVLAVTIAGMSITPVLADDRGDRERKGNYERKGDHGRKVYHGHREYYGHREYDERGGYYYPAPVYAPPPVVYAPPPPPPGISIVFPIRIR